MDFESKNTPLEKAAEDYIGSAIAVFLLIKLKVRSLSIILKTAIAAQYFSVSNAIADLILILYNTLFRGDYTDVIS